MSPVACLNAVLMAEPFPRFFSWKNIFTLLFLIFFKIFFVPSVEKSSTMIISFLIFLNGVFSTSFITSFIVFSSLYAGINIESFVIKNNGKIVLIPMVKGYSTTEFINKIIDAYRKQ